MDTGDLISLLLIVGVVFAMFAMHRGGGRAHGGMGGGCCGGHGHDHGSADEQRPAEKPLEEEKKPLHGNSGPGAHTHEPATAGGRRGGWRRW